MNHNEDDEPLDHDYFEWHGLTKRRKIDGRPDESRYDELVVKVLRDYVQVQRPQEEQARKELASELGRYHLQIMRDFTIHEDLSFTVQGKRYRNLHSFLRA